jgi:hypothetical protein
MRDGVQVTFFEGGEVGLEVVGESNYQDALRRAVREVGRKVVAVLAPEPTNPYDSNAVSIWVGGHRVGYLGRDEAEVFQPAVERMMRKEGQPIALPGRIVGGEGGKPSLGIWLDCDPEDFGLESGSGGVGTGQAGEVGGSGLAWADRLPDDRMKRIPKLRALLEKETDAIDRHFMFNMLEEDLYRSREVFESALPEFDDLCERHHGELVETIRSALIVAFGDVPHIPAYSQSAIRWQKAHDFEKALMWAERGLEIYGDKPGRLDSQEDLQKRADRFKAKLGGA